MCEGAQTHTCVAGREHISDPTSSAGVNLLIKAASELMLADGSAEHPSLGSKLALHLNVKHRKLCSPFSKTHSRKKQLLLLNAFGEPCSLHTEESPVLTPSYSCSEHLQREPSLSPKHSAAVSADRQCNNTFYWVNTSAGEQQPSLSAGDGQRVTCASGQDGLFQLLVWPERQEGAFSSFSTGKRGHFPLFQQVGGGIFLSPNR